MEAGIFGALFLIFTGASILFGASKFFQKRNRNPFLDSKPTTLAERGVFVPVVIGRRRVSPIVLWAGDRANNGETLWESAWHAIAVGAGERINAIYINGDKLKQFQPMTRTANNPKNGTHIQSIPIPDFGILDVYWGEEDQPVNDFLGNTNRVNIASRWPHLFYVVWRGFKLDGDIWPEIEYEIDIFPNTSEFPNEASFYRTNSPEERDVISGLQVAEISHNEFIVREGALVQVQAYLIHAAIWETLGFDATGKSLNVFGGSLWLVNSKLGKEFEIDAAVASGGQTWIIPKTAIWDHPEGTFINDPTYLVKVVQRVRAEGANPGHCIAQMMFSPYPQGLGRDKALYNIDSLQDVAKASLTEQFVSSIYGFDGEEFDSILSKLFKEFGVILRFNVADGLYEFALLRKNFQPFTIPEKIFVERGEKSNPIGLGRLPSRIQYTFPDASVNYRVNEIAVQDDGRVWYTNAPTTRTEELHTVTDIGSAGQVVKRLTLAAQPDRIQAEVRLNRGARALLPGDSIRLPGYPHIMRITMVEIDTQSGICRFEIESDFLSKKLEGLV